MSEVMPQQQPVFRPLPIRRYLIGIVGIVTPAVATQLYFGMWIDEYPGVMLLLLLWSIAWGGCWMLRTDGKNFAPNHGMFGVVVGFIVSWYVLQETKGVIIFALFLTIIGGILGLAVGCIHKGVLADIPSLPNDTNHTSSREEE